MASSNSRSRDGPIAVGSEDFAQHAAGRQAGHAGQVDRGLGVSGAAQHAAFLGHQRKQVAGPHEVAGLLAGSMIAAMVSARSCAVMPVLQSL